MARKRIGGSFAPPLSDELLGKYKATIDALPESAEKQALTVLYDCCAKWWELPESSGAVVRAHPTGLTKVVGLDEPIKMALWDLIPWDYQLAAMQAIFDAIPAAKTELRDCAFHLLWFVKELNLDREPLTADKLTVA